jgi:hypothetical protein
MEVLWQLDSTYTCIIRWGTDTTYSLGNQMITEYGNSHQYEYSITDLMPGAKYYYKVEVEGCSKSGSFVAAPPDSASCLKFMAYGDSRSHPARHNKVASAIVATFAKDPAYQTFILSNGDLVNDGDEESEWDEQLFDPKYRSIQIELADIQFISAIGNHEENGLLFEKYFPYPFVENRYWSFDYGPAHFALIDQYVDYDENSAQLQWLADDLASSDKPWKFLCLHQPGWSAGNHENDKIVQKYIQPLCVQYGVAIVFAGHNHYYARAVVDGVQHITTGGGGAPLYSPDPEKANIVAAKKSYHFCRMEINGDQLHFTARTSANAVIDSFSMRLPGH